MIDRNDYEIYDDLVFVLAFVVSLVFMSTLLKNTLVASVFFYVTFIIINGGFLIHVIKTKKISRLFLIIAFLLCFTSISRGGFSLSGLKGIIIIETILVIFEILPKTLNKICLETKQMVVSIFAFSTVFMLVMYFLGGLNKSIYGSTSLIKLNFNNPNETGLWLVFFFTTLLFGSTCFKKTWVKVLLWHLAAALFYVLLAVNSRNSIIACVLAWAIFLIYNAVKKIELPKWSIMLALFMPIIIFVVYMIANKIGILSLFDQNVEDGKTAVTRVSVWQAVLNDFWNCLLVGDFKRYLITNAHNSAATLFTAFGLPTTVLIFVYFGKQLFKLKSAKLTLSIISVIIILITGCFEGSVFMGALGMYSSLLIVPSVTVDNSQSEEKTDFINFKR